MQLLNMTTSNQPAAATFTQLRYEELVAQRKACRACESCGLVNPSVCQNGVYDAAEIGPYTRWYGDLNAELMIVGQDWGGTKGFIENQGWSGFSITSKRLRDLLGSIGWHFELTQQSHPHSNLFLTNAALCLRAVFDTGPGDPRWFTNCSVFLRAQVELVKPKVIVALGLKSYHALMQAFGLRPKAKMQDAVNDVTVLPDGSVLIPMYHPGYWGTRSRSFEEQKQDWQRVKLALHNGRLQ